MQPLFATLGAPLLKLYSVPLTLWYAHKSVTLRLRLAERAADHVVTPTPESFRLPSRKLRVVGHGVDIERFVPAPRPPNPVFQIVTVGRLTPIKRTEDLIEAARLLASDPEAPPCCVRLVGDSLTGISPTWTRSSGRWRKRG